MAAHESTSTNAFDQIRSHHIRSEKAEKRRKGKGQRRNNGNCLDLFLLFCSLLFIHQSSPCLYAVLAYSHPNLHCLDSNSSQCPPGPTLFLPFSLHILLAVFIHLIPTSYPHLALYLFSFHHPSLSPSPSPTSDPFHSNPFQSRPCSLELG